MVLYIDAGLLQHLQSQFVRIAIFVDNSLNPGVDQHFGANGARGSSAVEGGASGRDSVKRGLDDGVGLCVGRSAQFVALATGNTVLLSQAANFKAVRKTTGSSVVPRRDDLLLLDEQRADLAPHTRRPRGNQVGELHEVGIPRGPIVVHGRILSDRLYREETAGRGENARSVVQASLIDLDGFPV